MNNEELKAEKRARRAKIVAIAIKLLKFVPSILYLILVVSLIPLLNSLIPYIDGSQELENAMTNSQLTAILLTLTVCYAIVILGSRIKGSR